MAHRLPPLSALRPFEAAARLESFSRAAEELHLTHGAISRQVRALEEHIGAPLFSRHGKRVTLTAAGRAFAERVRNALQEIAEAAASAGAGQRDNRLTVSVLPSFASRWLMPRLIRFMDAHPRIEVSVLATNALANFGADEVDVASRFGRGPWPPLVCEPFLDDEWFPVASPKMNRGKLPKEPKDLLRLRIIREDRDYWQSWFAAAGVPLQGPIEGGPYFNDATYSIQAALRGEGIALARRSIVGEDLERGTLKRLFKLGLPSVERYWFVSPKQTAETPKVKAFRDWVKAELGAPKKT
jgi:LysR family transcriptional regulator, glycine cleavage system transcriptional activator